MRTLSLLLLILLAAPLHAAESEPRPHPPRQADHRGARPDHPLRIRLDVDLPIALSAAIPTLVYASGAIQPKPAGYLSSRGGLSPLDAGAIDTLRPSASRVTDVLWGTMMALPVVAHLVESAVDSRGDGKRFARRFGADLLLFTEAMAINGLFTELIKFTAQRPRPYTYLDPADVQDADLRAQLQDLQASPDSSKSFLSGHTSATFTAAVTWSMVFTLKHPDQPGPLALLWGGTIGAASTVAVLRVVAGKHHPTDVLAGALMGTAIGILTPLAHLPQGKNAPPVAVIPMLDSDLKGAMIVGLLP